jgi:hypothetical protein
MPPGVPRAARTRFRPLFRNICHDHRPHDRRPSAEPPLLRSIHTTNFGPLLGELGVSLLVTTYQAGKLVVLRQNAQGALNTHFRSFGRPMGLAAAGDRLAVGTALEVWELHNLPAVARNLEPAGSHDACFLPRLAHVTGGVQVHEMAWVPRPQAPASPTWAARSKTVIGWSGSAGMAGNLQKSWRHLRAILGCREEDGKGNPNS